MRSEQHGLGILGPQLVLHQVGPQSPGCSHLGYLHVQVHTNAPEEGEAGSKLVNVNTGSDSCGRIHVVHKTYSIRLALYTETMDNDLGYYLSIIP